LEGGGWGQCDGSYAEFVLGHRITSLRGTDCLFEVRNGRVGRCTSQVHISWDDVFGILMTWKRM